MFQKPLLIRWVPQNNSLNIESGLPHSLALQPETLIQQAPRATSNLELGTLRSVAGWWLWSAFLLSAAEGFLSSSLRFSAFGLLLIGLELIPATRQTRWSRIVGCFGILVPLVYSIPLYLEPVRASAGSKLPHLGDGSRSQTPWRFTTSTRFKPLHQRSCSQV